MRDVALFGGEGCNMLSFLNVLLIKFLHFYPLRSYSIIVKVLILSDVASIEWKNNDKKAVSGFF